MRSTSRILVWVQVLFTVGWVIVWTAIWMAPMEACAKQHAILHCQVAAPTSDAADAWFWRLPDAMGLWRLGVGGRAVWSIVLFPALAWALLGLSSVLAKRVWSKRRSALTRSA